MEKRLFIRYLREEGVPFGVVVAVGPGQLGWSMCSKKDQWNRRLGLTIAEGRAHKVECWRANFTKHSPVFTAKTTPFPIRNTRWEQLYHTLTVVQELAERYFKAEG